MTSHKDIAKLRKAAAEYTDHQAQVPEVTIPKGGIVEFATSPEFLDLKLFPLQALILKVATLDLDRFTPFDYGVIDEWGTGFRINDDPDKPAYEGKRGTTPDLITRIEMCRAAGRISCEELVLVLGRRGSKSFLAAILVAWRLWNLLALRDPQAHYKIPT